MCVIPNGASARIVESLHTLFWKVAIVLFAVIGGFMLLIVIAHIVMKYNAEKTHDKVNKSQTV